MDYALILSLERLLKTPGITIRDLHNFESTNLQFKRVSKDLDLWAKIFKQICKVDLFDRWLYQREFMPNDFTRLYIWKITDNFDDVTLVLKNPNDQGVLQIDYDTENGWEARALYHLTEEDWNRRAAAKMKQREREKARKRMRNESDDYDYASEDFLQQTYLYDNEGLEKRYNIFETITLEHLKAAKNNGLFIDNESGKISVKRVYPVSLLLYDLLEAGWTLEQDYNSFNDALLNFRVF